MRILIVDDEYLVAAGLVSSLNWEALGFEPPVIAANGQEALARMAEAPVDILITDIAMAPMDGIELMGEVRRRGYDAEMIVLSCHNDFAYSRKAMQSGASDFLFKPAMMPDEIEQAILEAKRKRLARQPETLTPLKADRPALEGSELAGRNQPLPSAGGADPVKQALHLLAQRGDAVARDTIREVYAQLSREGQIDKDQLSEVSAHLLMEIMGRARLNQEDLGFLYDQQKRIFSQLASLDTAAQHESYVLELMDAMESAFRDRYRGEIHEAKRYMAQHMGKPALSVEEVARQVHLSKNYFSSLFRKTTGQTFTAYLTELRMRKATELYRRGNKKVYEIALEVGYADWRYFTKAYKRLYGRNLTDR